MGDKSAIEWTDASWNPVTGCSKVSPGCKNCYAEGVADRFWATQYPPLTEAVTEEDGDGYPVQALRERPREFTDVQCHDDRLDLPLRWKRGRRIFVNSMSDLFHEAVPDAFIDRVFAVMALAPQHTFQVLTKRAERMRHYFEMAWHQRVAAILRERRADISSDYEAQKAQGYAFASLTCGHHNDRFLPNVWLGVSVENQHFADERIPLLLQTPAAIRFVSAEPLLGPVDLGVPRKIGGAFVGPLTGYAVVPGAASMSGRGGPRLDWVIVGGESGPSARPCALEWLESVVRQCKAAGVPVFVKQLGAYVVSEQRTMPAGDVFDPAKLKLEHFATQTPDEVWAWRAGLRDRKGGDPEEWPSDLRVREFPRVAVPA